MCAIYFVFAKHHCCQCLTDYYTISFFFFLLFKGSHLNDIFLPFHYVYYDKKKIFVFDSLLLCITQCVWMNDQSDIFISCKCVRASVSISSCHITIQIETTFLYNLVVCIQYVCALLIEPNYLCSCDHVRENYFLWFFRGYFIWNSFFFYFSFVSLVSMFYQNVYSSSVIFIVCECVWISVNACLFDTICIDLKENELFSRE